MPLSKSSAWYRMQPQALAFLDFLGELDRLELYGYSFIMGIKTRPVKQGNSP